MNLLLVPQTKDSSFEIDFFQAISTGLESLAAETNKWPDKLLFTGDLGKELFDLIENKGWDLKHFNPCHIPGPVDKIIFEYSKPLEQIEDRGGVTMQDSLHGKTIEGIPGPETVSKIIGATIGQLPNKDPHLAYTIKRTVRPKFEIKLKRK